MSACARAHGELRHYHGDHGAHEHAHAQLLFGVDGGLDVEVEGHLMRVDATAGLIVPAGARHASQATAGAAVWVVDAPQAAGLDRVRAFALHGPRPPAGAAEAWLAWARQAPRVLPRRRLEPAGLARAVDAALHEPWPAARMAALCALSVPQFHARWRALTGDTPQAWLRARRLDEAERLLRAGWRADAVAARVGYATPSALLTALRRVRGVTVRALLAR